MYKLLGMGMTAHPRPRHFPYLRYVVLHCRDVAMRSSLVVVGSGEVVVSGRVVKLPRSVTVM